MNNLLFKKVFMLASGVAMMLAMMFIISCSGNNDKPNEPMNQVDDERILGTWYRCNIFGIFEIFTFNSDFTCEYTIRTLSMSGIDSLISHSTGTFDLKDNVLIASIIKDPRNIELGIDEEGEYLYLGSSCGFIYRREKCY